MLSLKSFRNGKLNPKAYLQRELSLDEVLEAPIIAWPLGVFDCSDTTDGAAAAIVVRAEDAKKFRTDPVLIKALELDVASDDRYTTDSDFAHVEASYRVASKAYEVAGVKNPRQEISVAEIDDVFSIAEAVSLEDLQFSPRGKVKENIESGIFNLDGKLPVQPDGGARCFGDAIGATGLRQTYEICLQLQGRANGRQIANPKLGLIHTIGSLVEPTSPNAGCAIFGL
jgi:acetyl-CoA C-acetyltransferase